VRKIYENSIDKAYQSDMIKLSQMMRKPQKRGVYMVNVDKLRDKIIENNMTIEGLAIDLKKNRSTVYRHFKQACERMTLGEVRTMSEILGLTQQEVVEIFLS
jgi:glucan phosphorylase